jgi:hypothetical protein
MGCQKERIGGVKWVTLGRGMDGIQKVAAVAVGYRDKVSI